MPCRNSGSRPNWSGKNDLLVYARPANSTRMDWYILGEDLKLHNLTQNLRSQPGARVIDDPAERSMLVESGGELWRIAPGSEPESVSQARVPKITGIQWVSSERSGKRPGDQ